MSCIIPAPRSRGTNRSKSPTAWWSLASEAVVMVAALPRRDGLANLPEIRFGGFLRRLVYWCRCGDHSDGAWVICRSNVYNSARRLCS